MRTNRREQYNIAILQHKWPGCFKPHSTRGDNEVKARFLSGQTRRVIVGHRFLSSRLLHNVQTASCAFNRQHQPLSSALPCAPQCIGAQLGAEHNVQSLPKAETYFIFFVCLCDCAAVRMEHEMQVARWDQRGRAASVSSGIRRTVRWVERLAYSSRTAFARARRLCLMISSTTRAIWSRARARAQSAHSLWPRLRYRALRYTEHSLPHGVSALTRRTHFAHLQQ